MSSSDLNFELESAPSASRLGRDALLPLKAHLAAESFSDLTLIISELTANAVKYGPGAPIGVSVSVGTDGAIRGHVDDGGSGGVAIAEADVAAGTGLGLLIVDSLARAWGVEPGTTRVWFELGTGNGSMREVAPPKDEEAIKAQIAGEVLSVHREAYGKGAESVQVLLSGDTVVVFLDGLELQGSEQFLVDAGHADSVIDTRHHFQQAIEPTFRAAVERSTGRRVISFASVVKLNPNYACEIFRLSPER